MAFVPIDKLDTPLESLEADLPVELLPILKIFTSEGQIEKNYERRHYFNLKYGMLMS